MSVDVVVVGGGVAGLWTLDMLVRRGFSAVLVERTALGDGQTVWSQGIIHGGVKYSLRGMVTGSAASIAGMPGLWRARLGGEGEPDLRGVRMRSEHCWLWQTGGLGSRLGMIGARGALRTRPEVVEGAARPAVLRACPGVVARLGEPVIDPVSLVRILAERHGARIVRGDVGGSLAAGGDGVEMELAGRRVRARRVVLCAGNGNGALRERLGLDAHAQQVRPLRMVMARGALPELNGHCVDRAHTRVTITSDVDSAGRRVWQIGGEVAERGAAMEEGETVALARSEILAAVPGLDVSGVEWATYLAPRAEGRTASGGRPEDVVVKEEGVVVTAWPTKLALAPLLAERVGEMVDAALGCPGDGGASFEGAEPVEVAAPAWERAASWVADSSVG